MPVWHHETHVIRARHRHNLISTLSRLRQAIEESLSTFTVNDRARLRWHDDQLGIPNVVDHFLFWTLEKVNEIKKTEH